MTKGEIDDVRNGRLNFAGVLPAVMLAGCATTAPLPPDAGLALPQDWAESEVPQVPQDFARYWNDLGDPLLADFVEQATIANLDIAQSAARLKQARAQLAQARAGYLPQVNASGGVQRDLGDFSQDELQFSLGADASWEADLFGRISGNVAASRADLLAAGYSLADLRRLVTGQVALTTIQARATAAQLAIARDTLAYQDENLQIARWRNQAGLVSSLDVEQARGQRAATAATVPLLESNLAASANAISTLIGEPPGRVLTLLEGSTFVPAPPSLAGFEAPAEALRRRPDVRGAEASLASAAARIGVARAQLFPLVRLTGNIGTGSIGIGNLFDVITGGLFAGVSQLIFDGGRTRAQIRGAEAAAEGALAAWRQQILGALEEVETASVDLRSARQRVEIQGEARDASANAALLARSQYQAGLTDFRTLLQAENSLLSARNAEISAQAERASAYVRLVQALGGGWSPEADVTVPPNLETLP